MYKRKTDRGRADNEQIMTAVRKVVIAFLYSRLLVIWGVMKTTPFHDFAFLYIHASGRRCFGFDVVTMLTTTIMQIVWELRQRAVPRH